jgi:hypothetical protein
VGCNEQSRPLLTFDIPQTALVATLDTYDFFGFSFILGPVHLLAGARWPIPSSSKVAVVRESHKLFFESEGKCGKLEVRLL